MKLLKIKWKKGCEKIMSNCEKLNRLLQVNKHTGEIKTCEKPYYRGHDLCDVYITYSRAKAQAYQYCVDLINELGDYVVEYGITSRNVFKFTFAGIFEVDGIRYVLWCTADYDRVYLLEK